MNMIWWILPALSGVIGLMLTLAGLGRLFKLRLAAGGVRFMFGVACLALAGVTTFAGLNLQTYQRLTYERPVATVRFDAAESLEDGYNATVNLDGGEVRTYVLTGDEFAVGAQVITFEPMSNLLGYDSVYRLDYIEGRDSNRYDAAAVKVVESNGVRLYKDALLDVHALAREEGGRFGVNATRFGSAVYAPMDNGLEYEILLTQDALVLRPGNSVTSQRLNARR